MSHDVKPDRIADVADDIQRASNKLLRQVTNPTLTRELKKIKGMADDIESHARYGQHL
jgi:hypothetical protein